MKWAACVFMFAAPALGLSPAPNVASAAGRPTYGTQNPYARHRASGCRGHEVRFSGMGQSSQHCLQNYHASDCQVMLRTSMRLWLTALAALAPLPAVSQQPLSPPDVILVDQDGVRHRFVSDLLEGRIAVISFVFTGCTTICSPVGANMGALDALLGGQVGSRVSLLSVTLDPFNDTPERLAKWRRQFDDKSGWRLLTGAPEQVDRVLYAMRQSETDIAQHDAFLWVGNSRTKTWTRVSSLAAPETIATLIRRMEDE
jgi:protein SCO1/2